MLVALEVLTFDTLLEFTTIKKSSLLVRGAFFVLLNFFSTWCILCLLSLGSKFDLSSFTEISSGFCDQGVNTPLELDTEEFLLLS